MRLLRIEMRRALHRRLVHVLLLLALLAIVVAGTVEFVTSRDLDPATVLAEGTRNPALMAHWWNGAGGDSPILVAGFFLVMGGLVGGASVVGAEWRSGNVTTVLTWEPRRTRLHLARLGSAVLLAGAIALVLQALLLLAFVPSVLAHGSTTGVDGEWLLSLAAAMARVSLLTGLATLIGCSLASLGRNTAAAIVVGWAWLSLGEGAVRSALPEQARWLIGENTGTVLTWHRTGSDVAMNSPLASLALLALYAAVLLALSTVTFERRDVAAV